MVPKQRDNQSNEAPGAEVAPNLFSERVLDEAAGYLSVSHQATGPAVAIRRGRPFLTIRRRRCLCGRLFAHCRRAQFARVWLRPEVPADA